MASTTDILREALAAFEKPAAGPCPEDIYQAQYWEMAGAHACLINGLLSVYEQATEIPKDKEQDFIGYALLWCATMNHHHDWEEELYYPMFAPTFDTSFIVAEHETFHDGAVAFEEYLVATLPAGATYGFGKTAPAHEQQPYSGLKVRELIDAFAAPLAKHLMQEVTYIEPDKVQASGLTEQELKHISDVSNKHMMAMPATTFLSYTVLVTPKYSQFPPAPGFVKSVLVPYVFSLPTRRFWQFAPKR
ncbi:hypothetical protein PsYK624_056790 [Phanerochaete sordida]|uniref:Hemerythrin-like domain-containing protein n=1 Tax=Phanerochaete sordida TaxID=48140 RepID=A0A9P3LBU8_9APHY|nr:hypothetical protein PsYK624_056790 [Phanerochaete sordida]